MPPLPASAKPSSLGVFRHHGFARFWASRFLASFAVQVVSVAIGWQVYDLTHDPLDLGLIGLVQFLPSMALVLVTGTVADRHDRRLIMALCLVGETLCGLVLLTFVALHGRDVRYVFATLVMLGILRAFYGPAQQSMTPNLVPGPELASAIAWTTSSWQAATILGPVAGGLLYGVSSTLPYGVGSVLMAVAAALAASLPRANERDGLEKTSWNSVVAGFRYVWHQKVVLGAISLDLFAVLLGGATALLPAYARDILSVGPWGLGLLRAAPGIGAVATAAWLTLHPVRDHAGVIMFACVALFGASTVLFGLSTEVSLSVAAMILMGAFDMVSVYVRETLIQLWTPDAVRGRVNAVNQVFVGASNELGEFRAGVSAALIGVVPAVVAGGLGTVAVAALWWFGFPALRRTRRLDAGAEAELAGVS